MNSDAALLRLNARMALDKNSDTAARALELAHQQKIPSGLAVPNYESLKKTDAMNRFGVDEMPQKHPSLAWFLRDNTRAAAVSDDVDALKILDNSLKQSERLADTASLGDEFYANAQAQTAYPVLLKLALTGEIDDSSMDFASQRIKTQQDILNRPSAAGVDLQIDLERAGESAKGTIRAVANNPSASVRLGVTQLPNTLSGIALGAAGAATGSAIAPGVGTAIGAGTGLFLGGVMSETGAWMVEAARKEGINLGTREGFQQLLQNKELLERLRQEALAKGVTTAAVDTVLGLVGAGVAGKVAAGASRATQIAAKGGQVVAEGLGEGISEAAGQQAATGDVNAQDVVLESVLGFGSGTVEAAASSFTVGQVTSVKDQMREAQAKKIEAIHKAAAATKTGKRAPSLIKGMVEQSNPDDQVYIKGDAVRTLYQSLTPPEQQAMTTAIPDLARQLEVVGVAGGDVILPLADYTAYIAARPELAAQVKDDVRFSLDGFSLRELDNQAQFEERVKELFQSAPLEQGSNSDAVKQRFMGMLRNAGMSDRDAETNASVAAASMNALSNNAFANTPEAQVFLEQQFDKVQVERQRGGKRNVQGTGALDTNTLNQARVNIDSVLALADDNTKKEVVIKPVSQALAGVLKASGFDVEGYNHTIDNYAIKHVRKRHGNAKKEASRGQIAVTDADFQFIPEILENPDIVVLGTMTKQNKQGVAYLKKMADGSTLYLEEIRTGKAQLAAVTMMKYPATTSSESILSALRLDAQSDSGNVRIIHNPVKNAITSLDQAVYHGSPHHFDAFSLEHLGKGEGAQAFGWGLYFTSNKQIAEYYRTKLSEKKWQKNDFKTEAEAKDYAQKTYNYVPQSLGKEGEIDTGKGHLSIGRHYGKTEREDRYVVVYRPKGQTYKADIPEDNEMLHWELPLEKQPEQVRTALEKALGDGYYKGDFGSKLYGLLSGGFLAEKVGIKPIPENASRYLNSIGIKGIKYPAGLISGDADPDDFNYVIFDDQAIKDVKTFYQGQNDARGRIQFMADRAFITLFEKADKSTFLHEMSHFYVQVLRDGMAAGYLSDAGKKDWETLKTFVGADSDTFTVEQEEKIASAFEAYLYTGKAPSVPLLEAFRRIKDWMRQIYQSLTQIGVTPTEEVTAVFDRMLATRDEIHRFKSHDLIKADPHILAMLNDTEQSAYKKKIDRGMARAEEDLLKKALRQYKKQYTDEYKALRERVKKQQYQLLQQEPLAQVVHFMRTGKTMDGEETPHPWMQIDRKYLKEKYFDGVHKEMPVGATTYDQNKKQHPDVLAELYGFKDGAELIAALRGYGGNDERLEQMTDAAMMRDYGDMMRDKTALEKEAAAAVMNSDERTERLFYEFRKINERVSTTIPAITREYLEIAAKEMIGRTLVVNLKNGRQYYNAELKAAREVGEALAKGDYALAAKLKQQQILNHLLYAAAREQADKVNKSLKYMRDLYRKDKTISENYDIDYVNAARSVMEKYDIEPVDAKAALASQQRTKDWLVRVAAQNPDLYQKLGKFISAESALARPYHTLTLDQFNSLDDAIHNLMHTAFESRHIEIEGKRQTIKTAVDDLLKTFTGKKQRDVPGLKKQVTAMETFKEGVAGFMAGARRVESWIKVMDRDDPQGAWRKYVWDTVNDAQTRYYAAMQEKSGQLFEALKPYQARLRDSGKIHAHELGFTFESRLHLLGMLSHLGNASNRAKLLDGRGWQEGQMQLFLDRLHREGVLGQEDWQAVQAVWDFYEGIKPEIQAAHRQQFGYYFDEVKASPVQTPFGSFKGGYVPARLAPLSSEAAETVDLNLTLETSADSFNFAYPVAAKGFTMKREENFKKPLDMHLGNVMSHLAMTMKFVHLAEPTGQVARVLKNYDVQNALYVMDGHVLNKTLMPWLQRVVRQANEEAVTPDMSYLAKIVRVLARRTGAQFIAYNIVNSAQNLTQIFPAMHKVGVGNTLRAFARYMMNPNRFVRQLYDLSPLMVERNEYAANTAQMHVRDLLDPPKTWGAGDRWTERHGRFLQALTENMVGNITFAAAFDKALKQGMDDKTAVKYAESVVRTTQGDMTPAGLSALEAKSPFFKAFNQFMGYFNMMINLIVSEIKLGGGASDYIRVYVFVYMLPMITANMIAAALRGDWPEEDTDDENNSLADEWVWEMFLLPQLKGVIPMTPVVGGYLSQGLDASLRLMGIDTGAQDRYNNAPFAGTLAKSASAIESVPNAIFGDGDASKAVSDFSTLMGMVTGLPLQQTVGKPLGYTTNVLEGDKEERNILQGVAAGGSSGR